MPSRIGVHFGLVTLESGKELKDELLNSYLLQIFLLSGIRKGIESSQLFHQYPPTLYQLESGKELKALNSPISNNNLQPLLESGKELKVYFRINLPVVAVHSLESGKELKVYLRPLLLAWLFLRYWNPERN